MEKQKQQEEHIKVSKELQRRINRMIRLTLSDFKVEALEQFDRNFEREAFFNQKWARRKHNDDTSRGLLADTGTLRRSITGKVTDRQSVVIESTVPYARIHNEGGTITVTRKMKGYFWWRYQTVTGGKSADGLSNRLQRKKNGAPRNNKRNRALNEEAAFYLAMALKPVGSKIIIPRRQFIGMHPELEKALRAIFESNVADIASGPDSV